MLSLLIDTSYKNLSVGISHDHTLTDFIEYEAWQRQSEYLIQEIDSLLKRNALTKDDIDEVIVAKGPGSYTGVRIALSVAKVMAFALKKPLYLVSSLEAYKDPNLPSICLMNARSGRSYLGVYEKDQILLPDTIMNNEEVLSFIEKHKDFLVYGDVSYLGIEGKAPKVLMNLKDADILRNLAVDVLVAKPVYLKDL